MKTTTRDREEFRTLIAGRDVRLSLTPAGTYNVPEPNRVYLWLGSLLVGVVKRDWLEVVGGCEDGKVYEDGGLWSVSLEGHKRPRNVPGIKKCYPYAIGDDHMTMWAALTIMLLEFDWWTGPSARVARDPRKRIRRAA
jgi:hypothetical protein